MANIKDKTTYNYEYTRNRELSWLKFNNRVLEESADETVPLIERLKFISIFSTNLDEFFMVRVGSLFDLSALAPKEFDNKSGMNASEQLRNIYKEIPDLIKHKEELYENVSNELAARGIVDLEYSELTADEKKYINAYYSSNISPILSPQIIDSHHPAPNLQNKTLYIASMFKDIKEKKSKRTLGLIAIPESLPKVVMLPGSCRFIRIENIIIQWAPKLYGKYKVESSCVIAATRNADVSFDSDKFEDTDTDYRIRVKKLIKQRAFLAILRLEIDRDISDSFKKSLLKIINVENNQLYIDHTPLDMKYVFSLIKSLPETKTNGMFYKDYAPKWPSSININESIIDQVLEKDRLLFFPYDSIDPFINLLNEAADNPDVVSIKITIYRLASASKIARTLCRAAENGKEVLVLMELRARFDEENNINWSKMLEQSGCNVIYGVDNFKCHSKICLITLYSKNKYSFITQIGTGNYNENTSKLYTDLSLMTSSSSIGQDGTEFFKNMLIGNLDGEYDKLMIAPNGLKNRIIQMIDKEISKGPDGYICMKVNSITEREVIDKLAEASQAGVQIKLIVRSICCVKPQVKGYTDNIHVTSIVGRYLEHARIYCFGKGDNQKIYIASADLMTRNLRRRVEIACPIVDEDIQKIILHILDVQLSDTAKASDIDSEGNYIRRTYGSESLISSQDIFMTESIHKEVPIKTKKKVSIWKKIINFLLEN